MRSIKYSTCRENQSCWFKRSGNVKTSSWFLRTWKTMRESSFPVSATDLPSSSLITLQWRTSTPGIEVAQKCSVNYGAQADWFCDSIWIWELNDQINLPLLHYWRNIFAQPLSLASTYLIGQKMWVPPCPMPVFHRQNAQDGSSCCCQMDLPQLQRQQNHHKGSSKWHSHHSTSLSVESFALIHNVKFC